MATPPATQRLAELLIEPRETLEVEAKCWIDIVSDGDHKALLAKAIIALANHGGGVTIIGFQKSANGLVPAQGRPTSLAGYTSDAVNAVVNRYVEPTFHCDVQILTAPGAGKPSRSSWCRADTRFRSRRSGAGQTGRSSSSTPAISGVLVHRASPRKLRKNGTASSRGACPIAETNSSTPSG